MQALFPKTAQRAAHALYRAKSRPCAHCLYGEFSLQKGPKTQSTAHTAPDVLGDCPRPYWDNRPRLSHLPDFIFPGNQANHRPIPCLQYAHFALLSTPAGQAKQLKRRIPRPREPDTKRAPPRPFPSGFPAPAHRFQAAACGAQSRPAHPQANPSCSR